MMMMVMLMSTANVRPWAHGAHGAHGPMSGPVCPFVPSAHVPMVVKKFLYICFFYHNFHRHESLSVIRRCLHQLAEVFREDNVSSLICFICGCKHVCCEGFDKFGATAHKGTIRFRTNTQGILQSILGEGKDKFLRMHNLSSKRFKDHFGDAVKTDPFLQQGLFEWQRSVHGSKTGDEAFCCPEDVARSASCKHDDHTVCSKCKIPICDECWALSRSTEKIPKALCNDNFIGYVHEFIVRERVTWLEATIAAPVFSGLVTYYLEGDKSSKWGNLMDTAVGKAERSWGVRGNIFSFLLPWEDVLRQLFQKVEDGDLSQWPMSPEVARHIVRVRFVRGPSDLLQKFRELTVRSAIVKKLAEIYIDRNVQDLQGRPGVLKIHAYRRCQTVALSLKSHAHERVDELYPVSTHGTTQGGLLPGLADMVENPAEKRDAAEASSNFDMKQSTMHDIPRNAEAVFEHVRPTLVTDEADAQNSFSPEVVAEHAMKHIVDMPIQMSNQFEDQFISKYMPRIFPWALNYDCGGAEYPDLFTDWTELEQCSNKLVASGIRERWRKLADEALLLPGDHAAMLATRAEMHIAGDWMVVPVARNLHWRYSVLHSAFICCKQTIPTGVTAAENMEKLVLATKKIWERMVSNTVVVNGQKRPINGNIGMLFSADNLSMEEKTILRSYLNTTSCISGCQAQLESERERERERKRERYRVYIYICICACIYIYINISIYIYILPYITLDNPI